jgi:hypothetical protein
LARQHVQWPRQQMAMGVRYLRRQLRTVSALKVASATAGLRNCLYKTTIHVNMHWSLRQKAAITHEGGVKHFPRFRAFVQCNYAVVTCVDSFTIFPLMYIALLLTVLK